MRLRVMNCQLARVGNVGPRYHFKIAQPELFSFELIGRYRHTFQIFIIPSSVIT